MKYEYRHTAMGNRFEIDELGAEGFEFAGVYGTDTVPFGIFKRESRELRLPGEYGPMQEAICEAVMAAFKHAEACYDGKHSKEEKEQARLKRQETFSRVMAVFPEED